MRELAIVFFVLTLVLEAAGALIWWSSYRKSRKGVSTQATVVERVMLGSGERGTVLVVEYPIGERTVRAKVNAQHAPFDVAPGDKLEIGYEPQEPGRIVLRSVKRPVSVFALGGICLLFGLFFELLG
jgi:hypothetical protein